MAEPINPADTIEAPEPVDSQTRARAKKELHERNSKERADEINLLKASYSKIKDEPAFLDILEKSQGFSNYHLHLAKTGVGYRQTGAVDEAGNPEQVSVFFTPSQRVSRLDKASGIEEIITYLKRMTAKGALQPTTSKKVVS